MAVSFTAEVNTSDLRSFLIQCGRCARVVHVHRREIKRLASAKAYFGSVSEKKKKVPTHFKLLQPKDLLTPFWSGFTANCHIQICNFFHHPECDTQGTSNAIDEDCLIGAIFIDLSKAFALAGHKLSLQNFKNVGPCRDCIKCFALT